MAGGRSWGISSPNADFDIRFVYASEVPWYLSIDPSRKDTIAFQLGAQVCTFPTLLLLLLSGERRAFGSRLRLHISFYILTPRTV